MILPCACYDPTFDCAPANPTTSVGGSPPPRTPLWLASPRALSCKSHRLNNASGVLVLEDTGST
ncbi:hypothetical protein BGZ60DRAFT_417703 [Tricladium varicosporioides]|nr:hypothetical protein BGZ60DRAFT_417703 [Hymenoscyphus varicosporioides]